MEFSYVTSSLTAGSISHPCVACGVQQVEEALV